MEANKDKKAAQEPKKLSKWGEWRRNPNREVWVIKDMRAVLR